MVSVILPVYNTEKFLAAAIESILNQSYTDFEFLIYNDGSTDNSAAIIRQYNDPRIRFFDSPDNKGYLHWLNTGISEARGRYIARMDSDDIALPNRFEEQVQFLEQHPEIAVAGTGIIVFDERGERSSITVSSEQDIRWGLIFKNRLVHPSVMMRRESVISTGIRYEQEFYGSEDYRFWTQAIKHNLRVTNLPAVLLKYREHGNNFTKKNRERQVGNSKRIAKEYLCFLFPDLAESKAESMIEKLYAGNTAAIVALYADFKTCCKPEELEKIIPHLRERLLELFFQYETCTLREVLQFRKAFTKVPSRFYADGKKAVLVKHYLKVKFGKAKQDYQKA